MNESIKFIFGNSVRGESFTFPTGTPNYIRYGYDAEQLIWDQKRCLYITPKTDSWNLAALKKHIKAIEAVCGMPAVVQLNRLTSLQRTNLIESGVAFVSGKGQVFIPFWGSFFEEKILNPPQSASEMTAAAQLVFLYLRSSISFTAVPTADISSRHGITSIMAFLLKQGIWCCHCEKTIVQMRIPNKCARNAKQHCGHMSVNHLQEALRREPRGLLQS